MQGFVKGDEAQILATVENLLASDDPGQRMQARATRDVLIPFHKFCMAERDAGEDLLNIFISTRSVMIGVICTLIDAMPPAERHKICNWLLEGMRERIDGAIKLMPGSQNDEIHN